MLMHEIIEWGMCSPCARPFLPFAPAVARTNKGQHRLLPKHHTWSDMDFAELLIALATKVRNQRDALA
jgi:hypothetical protein